MKVLLSNALAEVLCADVPAGADGEPKKTGLHDLQGSMAEIEKSCQVTLRLTEMGNFFPKTDCRVLTVRAEAKESLNSFAKRIVALLNEAAFCNPFDSAQLVLDGQQHRSNRGTQADVARGALELRV